MRKVLVISILVFISFSVVYAKSLNSRDIIQGFAIAEKIKANEAKRTRTSISFEKNLLKLMDEYFNENVKYQMVVINGDTLYKKVQVEKPSFEGFYKWLKSRN